MELLVDSLTPSLTPAHAPGRSVTDVSPEEAAQLLAQGAFLVDVRERALSVSCVPCDAPLRAAVPWLVHSDQGTSVNSGFVDDVLFAAGAQAPLVLLDAAGTQSQAAAMALSGATRERIHVVRGGMRAWASNLPVQGDPATALSAPLPASVTPPPARTLFRPKLFTVLAKGYGGDELRRDVLAGLSVGVIALSLSMALGIASESTPAAGLYTAVAAGFTVSALGGSRVSIGGPTAAFIPIVVGVAHTYGAEGLVTCTAMAGCMLVAMGALGLGSVIRTVPRPVITGFTAGIATFIFSTQLKDFLGLHLPPNSGPVPGEFLEKLVFLSLALPTTHAPSLGLALASFLLLRTYPAAWAKNVPPQIVAVVVATAAVAALEAGGISTGIETISSRFGDIPSGLPMPHLTLPSLDTATALLQPAFTIALLAAIESLLCCVVSDGMIDDKHDSNTELIAQGLANIASASVGGLPATGALARTAANIRCGGRSPVSGMVHALVVLFVMLVASPLAGYVPLPALAAVLVVVALNMGEWKNFAQLPGLPTGEAAVYLSAFMLTVLTDVTVAVEAGLVLSALLYLKRVGDSSGVHLTPTALSGVQAAQLSGVLLFGATDQLTEAAEHAARAPAVRVLSLDCSSLIAVDATGLEALEDAHKVLGRAGKMLVLGGVSRQPLAALSTTGLLQHLGHANVTQDAQQGAQRATVLATPAIDVVSIASASVQPGVQPAGQGGIETLLSVNSRM